MVYSSELGHHQQMVYRDQDGNLIVPSSASFVVQSAGQVRNENQEYITDATTSIVPYGFTRVLSSVATVYSLAAPPYPGIEKTILTFSTLVSKVRSAVPINFSTGALRVISMTLDTTRTSTEPEAVPTAVTLYGVTTALWAIKSYSGSTVALIFSSAT